MLILLPPSETKHPGGSGHPLDLDGLALPELRGARESVVTALVDLSSDEDEAARVLKLSARQRHEIAANAAIRDAPTMAAVDRYTGVLYDALGAQTLEPAARRWLGAHVLIQSAPFGPVGALDRIPAYRLAAGTTLPGLPPLRRVWAATVEDALSRTGAGFILDLRSEAYAALGPIPDAVRSTYVRVVTEGEGGVGRALNHFNKHAKGALVRDLAQTRPRISQAKALLAWADAAGWRLRDGVAGETEVVV
ncbi:peroxide stress protein YaaA [Microbacterium sp. Gd 4-13]|uniref:YaaA family protein n=1 Tax=Microbacterium sp. Gd 4-13 TaxID=2173179 RepID=UPI000D56894B|nr:peroxide stress protein YaaA [Microbacterium sp. Gd 4-13]PVW04675.1 peroxide stress protein YaaA [Microbacterium sp. Gd 4-13]